MAKRFSDANWTTFALLCALALTLVAIVFVPTRRLAAHRPPAAVGVIDAIEPQARADGVRVVARGRSVVVRGCLLDDGRHTGHGVFARIDGNAAGVRGRYGLTHRDLAGSPDAPPAGPCGFEVVIPTASLTVGEHHASVWLDTQRAAAEPLMADVAFTVE